MSVVPDDMPLSNRFDLNLRKSAVDARKRNELAKRLNIKIIDSDDTDDAVPINFWDILTGVKWPQSPKLKTKTVAFPEPMTKEELDDMIDTVLSKLSGEIRYFADADPKEARDTSRKNLLGMTIPDRDETCGRECSSFLDIDCYTSKIIEKCPGSSGFCDFIPFPGCEKNWTYIVIGGVVVVAALFILK